MWSWRCFETQCCAEHGRVVQGGNGGLSAVLQRGCMAVFWLYTAVHDVRVEQEVQCDAMRCAKRCVGRFRLAGRCFKCKVVQSGAWRHRTVRDGRVVQTLT